MKRELPRLALGGLLFVGCVLFVTPALMVLFVSVGLPEADPPAEPRHLNISWRFGIWS